MQTWVPASVNNVKYGVIKKMKYMKIFVVACLCMSTSACTLGGTPGLREKDSYEMWTCREHRTYGNVIVRAESADNVGKIEVSGVEHWGHFKMTGLERRWDFGLNDGDYDYAFVISPNGSARYYDFTRARETTPSMIIKCEKGM